MRHGDRHAGAARQAPRPVPRAPEPAHPHHVQAILGLQATAGNAAVSLALQRAPAHHGHHRSDPALAREMRGEAAQFAFT